MYTILPGLTLVSSNYAILASDAIVQFNCTSGSLVAILPSATLVTVGRKYEIRRASDSTPANTLTINTTSSQTIDGRTSGSIRLQPGNYVVVVSDGSNWQVVAIQETVVARYHLSTNQAVGTNAVILFNTLDFDTHNGYATGTGLYTVAAPGLYEVTVVSQTSSGTYGVYLKKNGTSYSYVGNANTVGQFSSGSVLVTCMAGDTMAAFIDSSATLSALGGPGSFPVSFLGIKRVS